jgi:hypothetical protein
MTDPVQIYLPNKEYAIQKGWKFHIQWSDNGRPCFYRRCTYAEAKRDFDKLTSEGHSPFVVDPISGETITMNPQP